MKLEILADISVLIACIEGPETTLLKTANGSEVAKATEEETEVAKKSELTDCWGNSIPEEVVELLLTKLKSLEAEKGSKLEVSVNVCVLVASKKLSEIPLLETGDESEKPEASSFVEAAEKVEVGAWNRFSEDSSLLTTDCEGEEKTEIL